MSGMYPDPPAQESYDLFACMRRGAFLYAKAAAASVLGWTFLIAVVLPAQFTSLFVYDRSLFHYLRTVYVAIPLACLLGAYFGWSLRVKWAEIQSTREIQSTLLYSSENLIGLAILGMIFFAILPAPLFCTVAVPVVLAVILRKLRVHAFCQHLQMPALFIGGSLSAGPILALGLFWILASREERLRSESIVSSLSIAICSALGAADCLLIRDVALWREEGKLAPLRSHFQFSLGMFIAVMLLGGLYVCGWVLYFYE
ncbi:MAG: hypothetical protein M5U26_29535 [Planctomycetota bacterium]|nr:hypothetical protein [Planctomycetota bacterium]